MKKMVFAAAFLFSAGFCQAQDNYYNYNRQGDQYVATYYGGTMWGVNGFRTVEEENRIMEKHLAELRRQYRLDTMTPQERDDARRRRVLKEEVRQDVINARREKEAARRKPQPGKDTVTARKEKETAAHRPQPKKDTVTARRQDVKKKK